MLTIKNGVTNAYLLPIDEGYLLIDTGYAHKMEGFLQSLHRHHIAPDEVRYLLLTHHHDDHAGFTAAWRRAHPLPIIAHRAACAPLAQGANDTTHGGGMITRRIAFLLRLRQLVVADWDMSFPPVTLDDRDLLVDGDDNALLRNLGLPARILSTPGHTEDSISVLMDNGDCFCGDAAMSWPLIAGIRYCGLFTTNVPQTYAGWRRIIAAGAETIYPAHGRPFPVRKLEENLDVFSQDDLVLMPPSGV